MKKNAGFTLVELIVVIAILGILAGIAIPVYSGYITKANDAADLQQLDAIKTAAVFAAVEADTDHDINVQKIVVTANGTVSAVAVYDSAESAAAAQSFTLAGDDAVYKLLGEKSAYPQGQL